MKVKQAFGLALQELRKDKQVTQEDFSLVSSRTYISLLERGLKSPTLDKIEDLSRVLKVHPLSLLCLTYQKKTGQKNIDDLLDRVRADLSRI